VIGGQSDAKQQPVGPTAVRILAVSGGLRAASSDTQVLLAMTRLAPPGVEVDSSPEYAHGVPGSLKNGSIGW
jgi:NAD(P)H-dependent FMN reductase